MPFTDDRKIVTSSADGQVAVAVTCSWMIFRNPISAMNAFGCGVTLVGCTFYGYVRHLLSQQPPPVTTASTPHSPRSLKELVPLVLENSEVETKRLGKHQGRVHNLAVEPGSPYIFYSCGVDGFIQHFDLRSNSARKLFCRYSFTENKQSSSSIRLNAIVIDPRNPNYFAVGGSDEYARVYDTRKYQLDARPVNTFCPRYLIETHDVHITALAYSHPSEFLVSYNDELIYLFQKNMGIGMSPLLLPHEDLQKLEETLAYEGHRNSRTIKGIMESNRQAREDHSRITVTPDVIMRVLRLHRRQALTYIQRRYNTADVEGDEEDEFITAFSGDVSSEDGNSRECSIS
ncbi:DDB1- and CUL4-associated factor 8 [Camellia lanceoleosa]|uniref:DDB1- and CUL4-associated factor 8 n=1 Tax=Camellia lanceoleosa TaxID=1840588 RepID=A0ACC0HVS9_9ERIC|nr:DDB1- and CUL4-associated factor 8 [Camellia lanceoleosa]